MYNAQSLDILVTRIGFCAYNEKEVGAAWIKTHWYLRSFKEKPDCRTCTQYTFCCIA